MHLAFMNDFAYDPAMQRYIEKHTQEQPVVRIVDLMAAAQRYMHNKTGTSGAPRDKPNRKNEPGHYAATRANRSNQEFSSTPQFGVLKTGRKEALYHDDPAVASQVEVEQEKFHQKKTERANNQAAASRRELEVMQEQLGQLKQLVEQQIQAAKGNETVQGQAPQQTRSNNYRGRGRYNNNNNNNYR